MRARINGATCVMRTGGLRRAPATGSRLPRPTGRSASAAAASGSSLGSPLSQTSTFDYDDVVFSRYYTAYPLGPHVVRLLVPETTGATVSGTSGELQRVHGERHLGGVCVDVGRADRRGAADDLGQLGRRGAERGRSVGLHELSDDHLHARARTRSSPGFGRSRRCGAAPAPVQARWGSAATTA